MLRATRRAGSAAVAGVTTSPDGALIVSSSGGHLTACSGARAPWVEQITSRLSARGSAITTGATPPRAERLACMVSLLPRPRTCPQPRPCRAFGAGRASVTMAVLLASVAAGCGGGAHGHRAAGTRGGRGVAPGPYRWLVPTTGPQPTIAEENAHPGTT